MCQFKRFHFNCYGYNRFDGFQMHFADFDLVHCLRAKAAGLKPNEACPQTKVPQAVSDLVNDMSLCPCKNDERLMRVVGVTPDQFNKQLQQVQAAAHGSSKANVLLLPMPNAQNRPTRSTGQSFKYLPVSELEGMLVDWEKFSPAKTLPPTAPLVGYTAQYYESLAPALPKCSKSNTGGSFPPGSAVVDPRAAARMKAMVAAQHPLAGDTRDKISPYDLSWDSNFEFGVDKSLEPLRSERNLVDYMRRVKSSRPLTHWMIMHDRWINAQEEFAREDGEGFIPGFDGGSQKFRWQLCAADF